MKIAIVVVAYNRPKSLKRLLDSINSAYYIGNVPLVISVDFQDSKSHLEVLDIAKKFEWEYGEKRIIEHKQNLGLKKHIISCGNLTSDYSAVIILEDDLYVSKQYYNYAKQMLLQYESENEVAGISLYAHAWNVNANRPFIPEPSEFDIFFMQFAQSWGQCWNARMWAGFYNWYLDNNIFSSEDVPSFVSNWPDSSWLKHFIGYLVKENKFFVYPYVSLSTNFSDSGTHNKMTRTSYQVVMQNSFIQYKLADFNEKAIRYDAFFERMGLGHFLGMNDTDLCVDLYNTKQNIKSRYWLTTQSVNYSVIKAYGLDLRPHEANVVANIPGNDIYLYDLSIKDKRNKNKNLRYACLLYDYKNITIRDLYFLFKTKIIERVLKRSMQ